MYCVALLQNIVILVTVPCKLQIFSNDGLIKKQLQIARDTSSVPYGSLGFGGIGGYGNQIDAYYGTKPLSIVNAACNDGIKVNFAFLSLPINESFTAGQIPQLIFSV